MPDRLAARGARRFVDRVGLTGEMAAGFHDQVHVIWGTGGVPSRSAAPDHG